MKLLFLACLFLAGCTLVMVDLETDEGSIDVKPKGINTVINEEATNGA